MLCSGKEGGLINVAAHHRSIRYCAGQREEKKKLPTRASFALDRFLYVVFYRSKI